MPNNPATRRAGAEPQVPAGNTIVRRQEQATEVGAIVSTPKSNLSEPAASTPSDAIIPAGVIVMWSGLLANVPVGWALCDGTNSTPDLRDRFIHGWSAGVDPGGIGGTLQHKHSLLAADGATAVNAAITAGTPAGTLNSVSAGTPSGTISTDSAGTPSGTVNDHTSATVGVSSGGDTDVLTGPVTHVFTGDALAGHSHTFTGAALPDHTHTFTGSPLATHTHVISGNTARQQSMTGSIVDADTLPPFFKLAFIIKLPS